MCTYTDIIANIGLANGQVFRLQLLVMLSICASIAFWVFVYKQNKVRLKDYVIPLCLWIVFGALDIIITTRGTFGQPGIEGNPLSKWAFVQFGYYGPVVASVVWIAFWAGLVFVINKLSESRIAKFISFSIFYSLAIGHFLGFASWFSPLCSYAQAAPITRIFGLEVAIGIGCLLGLVHALIIGSKKQQE